MNPARPLELVLIPIFVLVFVGTVPRVTLVATPSVAVRFFARVSVVAVRWVDCDDSSRVSELRPM